MRPARDCPRYDSCSVTLCPLDTGWRKRSVLPNEPVCAYLREADKPGTAARFVGRYDQFVIEAAQRLRETLRTEEHPRYASVLVDIERHATTPSLIDKDAARSARGRALAESRVSATLKLRAGIVESSGEASEAGGES